MKKHLKTSVIKGLSETFVAPAKLPVNTKHKRGVHYFNLCDGIEKVCGAFDTTKQGQKYRKRIIVRPSRHRNGLHELYTLHFPKHWSEECLNNREIIKQAQRIAHKIEHMHSFTALEWKVRFFKQYYNPEPGKKRYPHFYTFVFNSVYRSLRDQQHVHIRPVVSCRPFVPCSTSFVPCTRYLFQRQKKPYAQYYVPLNSNCAWAIRWQRAMSAASIA